MEINTKQKKFLKGLSHNIKPSIIIGKDGLTSGTLHSIVQALENKELIKIKFNAFKDKKNELAKNIELETKSSIISKIGNVFIYFRQNSDIEKRKYFLDKKI
tara:strand:+ start:134 stop:439 length:306 start_codon:yes stop_codon:yes gene_type:complete